MKTKNTVNDLEARLAENSLRNQFVHHEFFRYVEHGPLTMDQVAIIIGQWWHPLHYFSTFLARCVATLPDIESKSAIARILAQESGEGSVGQAHEVIFIRTMERAGFTRDQITEQSPFPQTAALVAGYEHASLRRLSAIGSIFATEVTDLLMVSAVGKAVSGATGVTDLEWVDIHLKQEPDHVAEANHTLLDNFGEVEESQLIKNAEQMWHLWIGFFDQLELETTALAIRPLSEGVRHVRGQ